MSNLTGNSKRSSAHRFVSIFTLLTMVMLALPASVFADSTGTYSGDTPTPTAISTLAFGSVCANTTVTKGVLVGVNRQSSGTNVFKNGSTVTVSGTTTGTGLSAGSGTIVLPANWGSLPNGTVSPTASSTVTLNTGSAGSSFSGTITYQASGVNASDGTIIRPASPLPVTATVVACDTTPPVLSLPSDQTLEATGPTGATYSFTASATDANPAHPTVTCTPASGSTFPLGTTTVNCEAKDAAGNVGKGSFKVTVQDSTPPTINNAPGNIAKEATGASGAVASWTQPTATDIVDGTDSVTCDHTSGSTFAIGATTVKCSATDNAKNTTTSTFTVTVQDTTPPVITVKDVTAEASSSAGTTVSYTTTATDVVDGSITPACSPASGSTFPLGSTTVTCTATDAHGNKATQPFTVTVQDTTAPALMLPSDLTAEATGPHGANVPYTATASDLVDGSVTPSCSPISGSLFALGATPVNCSATDAHNNTANGSFKVTVQDTTPPQLTLPNDMTAEATGPNGAAITFTTSATDIVDGTDTVSCDHNSGDTLSLGTTKVSCSATDAAGNKSSGSFTVTVQDTTPPTITQPKNVSVEATGPNGAKVTYDTPTASDVVDGTDAVTCDHPSGSTFPVGETTVTCQTEDASHNSASVTFTVDVVDTTPPTLKLSADELLEATGPNGAPATFNPIPSAYDLVDGNVSVTCNHASGDTFALGSTTVTCSAKDSAGNEATGSFTITVQDTTPPTLSLPDNSTVEATGASGAAFKFTTSATDLVDGTDVVNCDHNSGATFPLGTTTVTCSATDKAGNSASGNFTVKVQDTTPPQLTLPNAITVEATGPNGATATFTTSATDLVDGTDVVNCDHNSGDTFPLGTTQVSCSATDAAGNKSSGSFNVTVQDTTPPTISVKNVTSEATGPNGAVVNYTATATDLVDGTVPAKCDTTSGSTFPLGSTTVTCTAIDAHGNKATQPFTVTVQDTTAPALMLPSNLTEEATGPGGANVPYTATAYDLVDGNVTPSCSPVSDALFALGVTPVNCSATDAHNNTANGSFKVTVHDTTPPTLSLPDNATIEATGASGASFKFTTSATDLVDGTDAVLCDHNSGDTFPLGTTTVSCSATDAAGNPAFGTFTVKVQDTTPPQLTLPNDMVVEATGPSGASVGYAASATDIVDGTDTVTCDHPSGSTFALGGTTVSCSATDKAGNMSSGTFKVTVKDTTPPALTLTNKVAEATGPLGATVSYSATATDLVDGNVAANCSPASGSAFPIGTTTVTCSATDAHGNTANGTFTVTVQDTTAPTISGMPANITKEATGPAGATASWTAPSASDIVDGPVPVTCDAVSGSTFPIGTTTVTCSSSDAHSNTAKSSFTITVQDTTAPALKLPSDISVYGTSTSGATVNFATSATDIVDGSVTPNCVPPSGSTFGYGTTTVTCSATDAHNNTATGSFKVTVSNWTVKGFYQPVVDSTSTSVNTVKNGSTVPFKFNVYQGSTELTSVTAVKSYGAAQVACGQFSSLTEDPTTLTTTGNTTLRYDTTGGQFIFNWQTPQQVGTCWVVKVVTQDGSSISANFKLK